MKRIQWFTGGLAALILCGAFLAGSVSTHPAGAQASASVAGLPAAPAAVERTRDAAPVVAAHPAQEAILAPSAPAAPAAVKVAAPNKVAGQDTDNVQVGDQQGTDTGGTQGVDNEPQGGPDTDNIQQRDQQGPDTAGPETPDASSGGSNK